MRGTAAKRSMDLTAARHERRVRAEVHKLDLKIERTKEELFPEYFGKDAYIMMPSSSDDREKLSDFERRQMDAQDAITARNIAKRQATAAAPPSTPASPPLSPPSPPASPPAAAPAAAPASPPAADPAADGAEIETVTLPAPRAPASLEPQSTPTAAAGPSTPAAAASAATPASGKRSRVAPIDSDDENDHVPEDPVMRTKLNANFGKLTKIKRERAQLLEELGSASDEARQMDDFYSPAEPTKCARVPPTPTPKPAPSAGPSSSLQAATPSAVSPASP